MYMKNFINEEALKELKEFQNESMLEDQNLNQLLNNALLEHNFEEAQKLIEQGADVNETNENNETRLIEACYKNEPKIVEFLIKNEAFLDIDDGIDALEHACVNSNFEIAELLIQSGVNINKSRDKFNRKLLNNACFSDNEELIEFLIKNGARKGEEESLIIELNNNLRLGKTKEAEILIKDIDIHKQSYGISLFTKSCKQSNLKLTKFFIDNGGLDHTYENISPLEHAIFEDRLDVAQLLIKNGVTISETHGKHLLTSSCFNNKFETIKFLIENEVDINSKDYNGNTLVHELFSQNGTYLHKNIDQQLNMCKSLIEIGANINLTNNYGQSPFQIACQVGKPKIVEKLFEICTISKKDFIQLKSSFPNDYMNVCKAYFNNLFVESTDLVCHDKDSKEASFSFLTSFKIWKKDKLYGTFPKPLIKIFVNLANEWTVKEKVLAKFNISSNNEVNEKVSECESLFNNMLNTYILDGKLPEDETIKELVGMFEEAQN